MRMENWLARIGLRLPAVVIMAFVPEAFLTVELPAQTRSQWLQHVAQTPHQRDTRDADSPAMLFVPIEIAGAYCDNIPSGTNHYDYEEGGWEFMVAISFNYNNHSVIPPRAVIFLECKFTSYDFFGVINLTRYPEEPPIGGVMQATLLGNFRHSASKWHRDRKLVNLTHYSQVQRTVGEHVECAPRESILLEIEVYEIDLTDEEKRALSLGVGFATAATGVGLVLSTISAVATDLLINNLSENDPWGSASIWLPERGVAEASFPNPSSWSSSNLVLEFKAIPQELSVARSRQCAEEEDTDDKDADVPPPDEDDELGWRDLDDYPRSFRHFAGGEPKVAVVGTVKAEPVFVSVRGPTRFVEGTVIVATQEQDTVRAEIDRAGGALIDFGALAEGLAASAPSVVALLDSSGNVIARDTVELIPEQPEFAPDPPVLDTMDVPYIERGYWKQVEGENLAGSGVYLDDYPLEVLSQSSESTIFFADSAVGGGMLQAYNRYGESEPQPFWIYDIEAAAEKLTLDPGESTEVIATYRNFPPGGVVSFDNHTPGVVTLSPISEAVSATPDQLVFAAGETDGQWRMRVTAVGTGGKWTLGYTLIGVDE